MLLLRITLLFLVVLLGYSNPIQAQKLSHEIYSVFGKSIKQESLIETQNLADINPGYPNSWIKQEDYIRVELKISGNEKSDSAFGTSADLNKNQKFLISNAVVGDTIKMMVSYKNINVVTQKTDTLNLNYRVKVLPFKEAEFEGGFEYLKENYLQNTISQITDDHLNTFGNAIMRFTIGVEGSVENIRMIQSANHLKFNASLIDALHTMPKWIPAQNKNGIKVKQEFEWHIGNMVGC